MKDPSKLIKNREYIIDITEPNRKERYKGTYTDRGFIRRWPDLSIDLSTYYNIFSNVTLNNRLMPLCMFYDRDVFYDLQEIRDNSKKARESFEQRSLNMILKQIVNEHFQWF
jgi:hypothetical protein